MKKKLCILTATRAEYGLLKPVIKKFIKADIFEVTVVVTGSHMSPEFGSTFREIESDQIPIDEKIEILLSSNSAVAVSKSMGLALISFAEYFQRKKPDIVILLGDRYETLAVGIAAANEKVPIAHLYGGETTEGAIDEAIRHSLTKLSYIHFTSTKGSRKRVIQLGEAPERVFSVGALGVENALHMQLLTLEELEKSINFALDKPYGVVTFHPVTLELEAVKQQAAALLNALGDMPELNFIITKSNADAGGRTINQLMSRYSETHTNAIFLDSLGTLRYLSALKYASVVIGNSSSGLIEAPAFHVPAVNVGNRQKGREQSQSVINCKADRSDIKKAITKALSEEWQSFSKTATNPYGDGKTSDKIVSIITAILQRETIDLKKRFYDVEFHL